MAEVFGFRAWSWGAAGHVPPLFSPARCVHTARTGPHVRFRGPEGVARPRAHALHHSATCLLCAPTDVRCLGGLAQRTGPLLQPRPPPVGHTNASAFSNALKALRSAPGAASTPRRDQGQYSNFPSRQRRATPWRSLSAPLAPKCGRAQSPGSLACARRPNVHRGAGDAATPKVCLFCARSRARPKASCSRAPAPLQAAPSAKQRSHRL